MKRFHVVTAGDVDLAKSVDLIRRAGLRVTIDSDGFHLDAGPFANAVAAVAHLVTNGFHFGAAPLCVECSPPADQLCVACAATHMDFGAADGEIGRFGEVRSNHPSAASKKSTLEVVR